MNNVLKQLQEKVDSITKYIYTDVLLNPKRMLLLSILFALSINMVANIRELQSGMHFGYDMWYYDQRIQQLADSFTLIVADPNSKCIDPHLPLFPLLYLPFFKAGIPLIWVSFALRLLIPVSILISVYLITDSLTANKTIAGIAVLFLATIRADSLFHGLTMVWTTFGMALVLWAIYFYIKFYKTKKYTFLFASSIFTLMTCMTHLVPTFVLFIFFAFAFILDIYQKRSLGSLKYWIPFMIPIIPAIIFYIQLIMAMYAGGTFELLQSTSSTVDIVGSRSMYTRYAYFYFPWFFGLFQVVFSILGVFYLSVKDKYRNNYFNALFLFWMVTLFTITQISLIGLYMANFKFMLYLEIPLVIFAGIGFVKVGMPYLQQNHNTFVCIAVLVLFVAFCMFPTAYINASQGATVDEDLKEVIKWSKSNIPGNATLFTHRLHFYFMIDHTKVAQKALIPAEVIEMDNIIMGSYDKNELKQTLSKNHIDYIYIREKNRVQVLQALLGDMIEVAYHKGNHYILKVDS